MTTSRNRIYSSRHRGCRGGPKCRHCTWDTMHLAVDGPHAKYTKGHRGNYNRDIDHAIDDFLATLKLEAGQLLVRDETSNNGTWIAGSRVAPGAWIQVPPGAPLRFGPVEFEVQLEAS